MRKRFTARNPERLSGEQAGTGFLRHGAWDAVFVGLALAHGALLLTMASVPLIALGFWWNANTIAHNFVHQPFFRVPQANALFSAYLSLLLGVPQRLWRDRHLAHHAGKAWRWRWSRALLVESSLALALWASLASLAPLFLLKVYLPGFLLGLALCQVQGHFEHHRGATSHYGWLYNLLFFNDGYHVEHHARPADHWRDLPKQATSGVRSSRWPAVLRWLDLLSLEGLERCVLNSATLQNFVLRKHEQAFRALLPRLASMQRIGVVGGGLFPRSALVLRRLLPEAEITIIDSNAHHLRTAGRFLNGTVRYVHEYFDGSPRDEFDLLIIPLAFLGDRSAIYRQPPARAALVHDWIWRPRGTGAIVSVALLKRLNLVTR